MLSSQKIKIGSSVYEVSTLTTEDMLDAASMVLGIIGPTLGKALQGVSGKSLSDFLASNADIAGAISECTTHLSRAGALKALGALFIDTTQVKSDAKTIPLRSVYSSHFAGKLDEWGQWVIFCLRVNYSRFFDIAPSAPIATTSDTATAPSS